jgi:hypothetical protein
MFEMAEVSAAVSEPPVTAEISRTTRMTSAAAPP